MHLFLNIFPQISIIYIKKIPNKDNYTFINVATKTSLVTSSACLKQILLEKPLNITNNWNKQRQQGTRKGEVYDTESRKGND